MNEKIVVFVGSTLRPSQVKELLPDACILPPIACGDLLKVILKIKLNKIAIIDGYFEHTGAVWHKEIIYAMQQGITVYGAASMGALRAAELADFGMIGIGKIFNDYYTGALEDDDEVAVIHRPNQSYYEPITDAMVNIRATIAKAIKAHIIEQDTAQLIISTAKNIFYKERILEDIINQCLLEYPEKASQIENFQTWLKQGNYVDQKVEDALELLHFVRQDKSKPNHSKLDPINNTFLLKKLLEKSQCEPDETELHSQEAQQQPGSIKYTRLLAYLIKATDQLVALNMPLIKSDNLSSLLTLAKNALAHEPQQVIFQQLLILFESNNAQLNPKHEKILQLTSFILSKLQDILQQQGIKLDFDYRHLFFQDMLRSVQRLKDTPQHINDNLAATFLTLKNFLNNGAENFIAEPHHTTPRYYYQIAKEMYELI